MRYILPFVLFVVSLTGFYFFDREKGRRDDISVPAVAQPLVVKGFSHISDTGNGGFTVSGTEMEKIGDVYSILKPRGVYRSSKAGAPVNYRAEYGKFMNASSLVLSKGVVVTSEDKTFKSEAFHYNLNAGVVSTDKPVDIVSGEGVFNGSGLVYRINEKTIALDSAKGRVAF